MTLNIEKDYIFNKINFFLILFLPIAVLAGSSVVNITICFIDFFFIISLIKRKFNILTERNFQFLIIIYLYLVLNSFVISSNPESNLKSLGFIRFFILAYALSYYFQIYNKSLMKCWVVIFLIVTFDIIFEYIFGKNIFGFTSENPRRIASFTNDELKIGGFYFAFIFLTLFYFYRKKNFKFWFLFFLFFLVSFIIGERSNFIKIFFGYFLFFIFNKFKIKKVLIYTSLLIILISPILVSNKYFKTRYLNIFYTFKSNNNDESYFGNLLNNSRHLGHYYIAAQIFKEKPILGKGFKSFRTESFKEKYYVGSNRYGSTHPHQFHFEILSELGLLGYLLIMINISLLIFRRWDKNDYYKIGSTIFIIGSLIPILPSGSFFTTYGATLFFINYSFLLSQKK